MEATLCDVWRCSICKHVVFGKEKRTVASPRVQSQSAVIELNTNKSAYMHHVRTTSTEIMKVSRPDFDTASSNFCRWLFYYKVITLLNWSTAGLWGYGGPWGDAPFTLLEKKKNKDLKWQTARKNYNQHICFLFTELLFLKGCPLRKAAFYTRR